MSEEVLGTEQWLWIKEVVAIHQAPLIRYAASLLGDGERAKDVVQETFIKLCRQDRKDLEPRLAAWLFKVTRNGALDALRRDKRMELHETPELAARRANGIEEEAGEARRSEMIGSLLDLVASLPPKQREVIELKFREGLSYREISELTGLSASNVGYLLHHGLKELKDAWKAAQVV